MNKRWAYKPEERLYHDTAESVWHLLAKELAHTRWMAENSVEDPWETET